MANRHLLRSIALQTLFEVDFSETNEKVIAALIERNVKEFAPDTGDFSYVTSLVENIIAKQKELDNIIGKAAPEWPIDKISIVDRNILRIGLYELLFADRKEVPAKVAINEAIELAKKFGGDSSGKFVNGVLGAVYKEIGEPGKDEISKKKKMDIAFEDMPIERLAGAVVYAREGDDVYLALVHDVFGHWTLSKGHIEEDEDEKEGLIRVIKDEIGLEGKPGPRLGKNEYVATQPEKGKIRKQVSYYLLETPFDDLKLKETGGLDDAKWFKMSDILELNFYDDMLQIVTKAVNLLLQKNPNEE
jgi:N utilization substance protein B